MPKTIVEGPDGRKFAFPDTMPRSEVNAFMREKYGTKAREETVDPDKASSSTLLAAAPFAAVGGAGLTAERELGARMTDDTIRADGTKKGTGFLGPLKRPDGMTMTEYSVGVNIDGKDVEIPTLVPTLTQDEINLLLNLPDGDKPPRAIIDKAIKHARDRIKNNKSPFQNPQDDGQSAPKKKD